MTHVQFGHFVVAEIPSRELVLAQACYQGADLAAVAHLHANKDMRLLGIGITVIEFSYATRPQQRAELPETARPFRNRYRQNGLVLLAQFSSFRDEPQALKVHVGAAGYRDQRATCQLATLTPRLGACDG